MNEKDRKFPSELENPIDNLILNTGKKEASGKSRMIKRRIKRT